MKLETLKDLEQAIKLCRKLGVDIMKIDGVEFHLGQLIAQPVKRRAVRLDATTPGTTPPGGITEEVTIPTTPGFEAPQLTEEQLLMWSVGGNQ